MDKNLLTIIAGLVMFLVFLLLKIEVSFVLCFIGLAFIVNGILKYFDYKKQLGGLLSATAIFIGISLIFTQFNLNYFVLGLFMLILIVLWVSNYYYSNQKTKM